MSILYTKKEAFEKVKKFLEENQYNFSWKIENGFYVIRVIC